MALQSDNQQNNILSAQWADNLLIKDKTGKVRYYKQGATVATASKVPPPKQMVMEKIPVPKPNINTAPLDDSFQPTPQAKGKASDKAELVFHPDDKKQIDKVAKDIATDDSKKYSVEKIVDRLIEKNDLKLDKVNKEQFTNIVFDFFRNRKKAPVVRQLLGGVLYPDKKSLDEGIVDNILSVIKGIKNKVETVGGLVVKVSEQKPEVKIEKDILESKTVETPIEPSKPKPIADKFSMPKPEAKKPEEPKVKEKKPEPKKLPPVKKLPVSEPLPKVIRQKPQTASKRPVMDVVKKTVPQPPKPIEQKHELTGPVQELANLNLHDFRRSGATVEERIEKILDKLNVLEQDSFTKRAQGIKAWRSSPVYKLYLQLGRESMTKDQEVHSLIDEYTRQEQDMLTVDEFSAISDLNKKVRF